MSNAAITIDQTSPLPTAQFTVTIHEATETNHTVHLSRVYLQQLGASDPEALVHTAFAFLLAREPNTAILSSFDLQDIEQHFPEFPSAMRDEFR